MKNILMYLFIACAMCAHSFAQNSNASSAITGTWLVQDGTAKIKIEKSHDKFIGKIVWLNPANDKNGKPLLDNKNPDKSLQSRPLMGLCLLYDFVYDGDNLWSDGTIYDADSGKTYSCKITLKDNKTMEVRGYVGISLFGRTDTWTRSGDVSMN